VADQLLAIARGLGGGRRPLRREADAARAVRADADGAVAVAARAVGAGQARHAVARAVAQRAAGIAAARARGRRWVRRDAVRADVERAGQPVDREIAVVSDADEGAGAVAAVGPAVARC